MLKRWPTLHHWRTHNRQVEVEPPLVHPYLGGVGMAIEVGLMPRRPPAVWAPDHGRDRGPRRQRHV